MRKLVVATLAALLLTVTAGPALANGRMGQTDFYWPAHCDTHVALYTHSWFHVPVDLIDARIDVDTCTSTPAGAMSLHIYYIRLFRNRSGNIAEVASWCDSGPGWCQVGVAGGNNDPLQTSGDAACDEFGDITIGDDVWANVKYQIFWRDLTNTVIRNDNSNAFHIGSFNDCQ